MAHRRENGTTPGWPKSSPASLRWPLGWRTPGILMDERNRCGSACPTETSIRNSHLPARTVPGSSEGGSGPVGTGKRCRCGSRGEREGCPGCSPGGLAEAQLALAVTARRSGVPGAKGVNVPGGDGWDYDNVWKCPNLMLRSRRHRVDWLPRGMGRCTRRIEKCFIFERRVSMASKSGTPPRFGLEGANGGGGCTQASAEAAERKFKAIVREMLDTAGKQVGSPWPGGSKDLDSGYVYCPCDGEGIGCMLYVDLRWITDDRIMRFDPLFSGGIVSEDDYCVKVRFYCDKNPLISFTNTKVYGKVPVGVTTLGYGSRGKGTAVGPTMVLPGTYGLTGTHTPETIWRHELGHAFGLSHYMNDPGLRPNISNPLGYSALMARDWAEKDGKARLSRCERCKIVWAHSDEGGCEESCCPSWNTTIRRPPPDGGYKRKWVMTAWMGAPVGGHRGQTIVGGQGA